MNNSFSFPLVLGLQKAGLPVVAVTSAEVTLCFVIDTGSTDNVLFSFVHDYLKDRCTLLEAETSTMGLEGEMRPTPIVEMSFIFEEQEHTSSFSVVEASKAIKHIQNETGMQLHGILGVPFLLENKCVIDFKNIEIRGSKEI